MRGRLGDRVRLLHILDAIAAIEAYTAGIEDFASNPVTFDATVRQLSIIGEACSKLSEELKNKYPDVEWRPIIGLRNIIVHEYFGIDDKVVVYVIKKNIPVLKVKIEFILENIH